MPQPAWTSELFAGGAFAEILDVALGDLKMTLLIEHARLFTGNQDAMLEAKQSRQVVEASTQTISGVTSLPVPANKNVVHEISHITTEKKASLEEKCNAVSRYTGKSMKPFNYLPTEYDVESLRAKLNLSTSLRKVNTSSLKKERFAKLKIFVATCAQHPLVAIDSVMAVVILLNAIVIGVSCDTPEWGGWVFIDIIFFLFFIMECFAKCLLLGLYTYFSGSERVWHWFEIILILFSFIEIAMQTIYVDDTGVLAGTSLFRVFRIVRITKLLRVCRLHAVADLVLMINGAIGGVRTLFWSIVLVCLPLYVLALIFRETLGEEEGQGFGADLFSTFPNSFLSVFRCVVVGDCSTHEGRPIFALVATKYGWGYAATYAITFLLMTFGLFNVIVAIYVENTVAAAKHNDIRIKEARMRDEEYFKEKALEMATLIFTIVNDQNLNDVELDLQTLTTMQIDQDHFSAILNHPGFSELLRELDIAAADQQDLFDTLDTDRGGTLSLDELVNGIHKLRGDARKADIVAIILSVHHVYEAVSDITQTLERQNRVLSHITKLLHGHGHKDSEFG